MEDDKQLLEQIASGDQKALEVFYQRHSNAVYQFAYKTLNNGVDASEVLNDVMMEIWKKANTYQGKSAVKTWLLSITHNKAVDAVRKKARHDNNDSMDEEPVEMGDSCDMSQLSISAENAVNVKHCMGKLSDSHRQVVYLTFFEGLSYTDISGVLEIPSGTVKTRMLHAKKQLMNCLSRLFEGSEPQFT